jgi:AbrB family looped-hinge helix DNA binding protein
MQTKVSTQGQVVLPGPMRRMLDIRAGDPLDAKIEDGNCADPAPEAPPSSQTRDRPCHGWPALNVGPNAAALSSREAEEILAKFP